MLNVGWVGFQKYDDSTYSTKVYYSTPSRSMLTGKSVLVINGLQLAKMRTDVQSRILYPGKHGFCSDRHTSAKLIPSMRDIPHMRCNQPIRTLKDRHTDGV